MVNLELWKKLLKLKINSFKDNSKKECWVFYKKDLEKLLKPKPLTKTQKKQRDKMYASMIKTLKETHRFPVEQMEKLVVRLIPRLRPNSKICSKEVFN